MASNISPDVIWGVTRKFNAYQVKRNTNGGSNFTRDPLNLINVESRKHSGFVNPQAVGLQPGKDGGVEITFKKSDKENKPGAQLQSSTVGKNTGSRKTYKSAVRSTSGRGYRADLHKDILGRASAIKHAQRNKKPKEHEEKPRGKKATSA